MMEEREETAADGGGSLLDVLRERLLDAMADAGGVLPPSPDQAARWLGVSLDQAEYLIEILEDEGYIDGDGEGRWLTEFALLDLADRRGVDPGYAGEPADPDPTTDQQGDKPND